MAKAIPDGKDKHRLYSTEQRQGNGADIKDHCGTGKRNELFVLPDREVQALNNSMFRSSREIGCNGVHHGRVDVNITGYYHHIKQRGYMGLE